MSDVGVTTFFGERFDRISAALPRLFGPLDAEAARAIKDRVEWVELSGGDTLFSQGDTGDCMYLVAGGRLQAIARDVAADKGRGGWHLVGEIAQGEPVGEMALLTGQPRAATVCAVRDSLLMRLDRTVFEELARTHPEVLLAISRVTIERLSGGATRVPGGQITNIAVLPLTGGLPVQEIAEYLTAELGCRGSTAHLSAQRVDEMTGARGRAQTPQDSNENVKLAVWLDRQSQLHRFVIYQAESEPSEWTRRCLRQADRVLLLTAADADPSRNDLEAALFRDNDPVGSPSCELVLLHRLSYCQPTGIARWYTGRRLLRHHHIRPDRPSDWRRLVRFLAGAAVGIVFAGGGARGFAHIGVVAALREAGIPLDLAGGTSMGAIIAAGVASDWDQATFYNMTRTGFTADNPLNDYNLFPAVSLIKGRKIDRLLRTSFGEGDIEDLWLPFFCVSSNLTRAEMTIHSSGTVWKAVRASLSLPGILPPVAYGDEFHVDGATFNNFPVDVMRSSGAGRIIAVDIDVREREDSHLEHVREPTTWEMLKSVLVPSQDHRAPGMLQTVARASVLGGMHQRAAARQADLYLHPEVSNVQLLDLSAFDQVVEIGYQHAAQRLAEADLRQLS